MTDDFDFRLKIYRDDKSPIWSYYLYETLSKAREDALDCVSYHPKVEIYAIGRGLDYGNDFVVETHFRRDTKIDKGVAFEIDTDKWIFTEETCK